MTLFDPSLRDLAGELQHNFTGRIVSPTDRDYDDLRVIAMGNFDHRPGMILRPKSAADVAAAVSLARDNGLELAVRSGGHSGAGHGSTEGGLVIDMRDMKALDIDEGTRTAWAETGLTAGEVSSAVTGKGLVVGFGDAASVGIGGITLGGGVGYFVRKLGLTIDSVLAAEVVTADGRIVSADKDANPDLFWAVRGGGGNFGVVTRLKFALNPLPAFTGGMMVLPATAETIDGFLAAADAAPEELSTILNVMPAPPMPFLAAEWHGRPVILAMLAFAGDGAAADRALRPFRELAEPLADFVKTGPFVQQMYPPEEAGFRPKVQLRTFMIDTIPQRTGEKVLAAITRSDAMMRAVQLRVLGGAASRVQAADTAYAHRGARLMGVAVNMYADDAEIPTRRAWAEETAGELAGHGAPAYVNFLGDEGPDRSRAAYPGATWDRLRQVKAKYDPQNLFRRNQNIPPAA